MDAVNALRRPEGCRARVLNVPGTRVSQTTWCKQGKVIPSGIDVKSGQGPDENMPHLMGGRELVV